MDSLGAVSGAAEKPVSPSGRILHPAIVQVGNALERCLEDLKPYLWEAKDPQPGSPWDVDRQQLRPSSDDGAESDDEVETDESALSDHPHIAGYWYSVGGADAMLGVRACLISDSLYSAGALSRVALEAFAWGAWIWESDLPLDNRILRGLRCRRHEYQHLINAYRKHLSANRDFMESRLLGPEDEEIGRQRIRDWKRETKLLKRDITTVQRRLGDSIQEPLPLYTELVAEILSEIVGRGGAGHGRYDLHSGLTHLGEGSISIRLPRDISDFRQHPNIELEALLPVVRESVIMMWGYLRRIAKCWGMNSPDERIQPLVTAILEASSQPEGTLLFTPDN